MDKNKLVGVDDPAIVKRYGGMRAFVYTDNGQCQVTIAVRPIGGTPADKFSVGYDFIHKPLELDKMVVIEDLPKGVPTVTPVYGKNLIKSLAYHIEVNKDLYLGDRKLENMSLRERTILTCHAANNHLMVQYTGPNMREMPPMTGEIDETKLVTGAPLDIYFPWALPNGTIFDELRMPTYTNDSVARLAKAVNNKPSGKFLKYIAANLFHNASTHPEATSRRVVSLVGKFVYIFRNGLDRCGELTYDKWGYASGYERYSVAPRNFVYPDWRPAFDTTWDNPHWHLKAHEVVQAEARKISLLRTETPEQQAAREEAERLEQEKLEKEIAEAAVLAEKRKARIAEEKRQARLARRRELYRLKREQQKAQQQAAQ